MAARHRLDNKYTAPRKGSLQEKIKIAEESIINEANSQKHKAIGICATGITSEDNDILKSQREKQLSSMSLEQKKTILSQQRYVEKNFRSGGTATKASEILRKIEDEATAKSCNTRQSVSFAGHLGRVKGEFAKVLKTPDEDHPTEQRVETSSQRSKEANDKLNYEIYELCDTIKSLGLPDDDGGYMVDFAELFHTYSAISSKTVGLLVRARRRGWIYFEGETLLMGRDDGEIITLLEMPPKPWEVNA